MLQIGNDGGRTKCGFRQGKWLWGPVCPFQFRLSGRNRPFSAECFHRPDKRCSFDVNQVIKRGAPSDSSAVPMPLAVGDFEAVVGAGAVFMRPAFNQLIWFICAQVGEKVPLLCPRDLFFRYPGMGLHLPKEILSIRFLSSFKTSKMLWKQSNQNCAAAYDKCHITCIQTAL